MDRFKGVGAMEGCPGIGAASGARARKESGVPAGDGYKLLRTAIARLSGRRGCEFARLSNMPAGLC